MASAVSLLSFVLLLQAPYKQRRSSGSSQTGPPGSGAVVSGHKAVWNRMGNALCSQWPQLILRAAPCTLSLCFSPLWKINHKSG